MTDRTFGQIVREARLGRHLSMGQLAAAVDRSTASVRRWERNDGLPTPDVVEALIERLDLDREDVESALGASFGEPSQRSVEAVEEAEVGVGDPIDVVPLADVADAVGAGSMSGWTPPPVPVAAAPSPRPPQPATTYATTAVPVAVIEQDQNLLQVLRDPDKPWLGYIRATLTIVVLLVLAWVLLWALPLFLEAVAELWDTLWETEEGVDGLQS